jgi:pimeloyl-ACP methyl ester carboxylesterase
VLSSSPNPNLNKVRRTRKRIASVIVSPEWLTTSHAEFLPTARRTGCADLEHYTAEYIEWGDGPPLVLVPGLAGGYDLLGPLASELSRHFRVISYQLRGETDPFVLRRRFDLVDLADDLAQFLDWHCLESPAVMGVSFGGVVALQCATRWPHRVSQLVLQGCGARLDRSLLQQVAGAVLSRYPLPPDSPFINQFFNLFFGGRQKPSPLVEFVTRQCWQTDQSVMSYRFRMVEQYDLTAELNQVTAPLLAVTGTKDLLVSQRSLRLLCEGARQSRSVRLQGSGHFAFVTHPGRIADEVIRFLS